MRRGFPRCAVPCGPLRPSLTLTLALALALALTLTLTLTPTLTSPEYEAYKEERAEVLWKAVERCIPDVRERIEFR